MKWKLQTFGRAELAYLRALILIRLWRQVVYLLTYLLTYYETMHHCVIMIAAYLALLSFAERKTFNTLLRDTMQGNAMLFEYKRYQ